MIDWLIAYIESLGYTALSGPDYFIMRKKDGNRYFDVDFNVANPEKNLNNITQVEAIGCVARMIEVIGQMEIGMQKAYACGYLESKE